MNSETELLNLLSLPSVNKMIKQFHLQISSVFLLSILLVYANIFATENFQITQCYIKFLYIFPLTIYSSNMLASDVYGFPVDLCFAKPWYPSK